MIYDFFGVKEAEGELYRNNYSRCLELCLNILRKSPGDALALLIMIRVLLKKPAAVNSWSDVESVLENFLVFRKGSSQELQSLSHSLSLLSSIVMKNSHKNKITNLINSLVVIKKKQNKTKVVILTCVWKRHELTRLFFSYYAEMRESLWHDIDVNIELEIVAVGSEGELSRSVCEKYGGHYIEYANDPLSEKWQAGLDFVKTLDFEALIVLGSDDFICNETFKFYADKIKDGALFVGFYDCYLHDLNLSKTIYWKGYGASSEKQSQSHRINETIGLGRMLRRELLDFMDFDLWGGVAANKSLDSIMRRKIVAKTGFLPVKKQHSIIFEPNGEKYEIGMVAYSLKEEGLLGVDVKVSDNITSFDKYCTSSAVYDDVTSDLGVSDKLFFLENYRID